MTTSAAPRAGMSVWRLDPTHSSVEFAVKHMMMTTVRGRFKAVNASLTVDEKNPAEGRVEVSIEAASLDTGSADRDAHLRSADFFDADNFPTITFRSKRIAGAFRAEGDEFQLFGDLTIRDTTTEIVLDCVFEGRGSDPWGKQRAGFTAKTEIDRREWGLKWNQMLEAGGILVANKVRIEAEVQFVREAAEGS